MNEFFASLISGVVSLFMQNKMNERQHVQNISDWQMQNEYNEQMYNNYNSPVARAEQLSNAGLSDAAIGQALSGFNGSGTAIQSSPLQPTNIAEMFSSIFGNVNDTMRLGNETALNKSEIRLKGVENGLKGKELEYWEKAFDDIIKKPWFENQRIAAETYLINEQGFGQNIENSINDLEYKVQQATKDIRIDTIKLQFNKVASEIGLNEAQKQQAYANTLYLIAKIEEINQLKDVREREAAEARFYKDIIEKIGVPYGVVKDAADLGKDIIKSIFDMFGIKWLNIARK